MQTKKKPSLFQPHLILFLSKETIFFVASYKSVADLMTTVFKFLGINIVKPEMIKLRMVINFNE